jgi:hypothetical protein
MNERTIFIRLGILLSAGLALTWASVGSAATCTIAPQNPTIDAGKTVSWSATVTGFSTTPSYSWTFQGGTPSSSTSRTRTVTYAGAGTFTTSLRVSSSGTSANCSTAVTVRNPGPVAPNVSINSTSKNSLDAKVNPYTAGPVDEELRPNNANSLSPAAGTGTSAFQVLAINDLGMHCGDLDTRISSILPPFQVLLSQVIQKGSEPKILGPTDGVEVVYSAASNPSDPILSATADPVTKYPFTGLTAAGDVYKTNFWSVAYQAYHPFYPPNILAAFYDPANPANNVDIGLPVPNVEHLYIGPDGVVDTAGGSHDGFLSAVQHTMPGSSSPYLANIVQLAEEHYGDKPFFVNFPFGYVANDVNWFEGAGIPFAAFDDFGRENPYPLVRVQAKSGTRVLASVDAVLPISGEANCQGCHAATQDGGSGAGIKSLSAVAVSIDDPAHGTTVPNAVSVEWASDKNILKLHDQKHGTALIKGTTADFPTKGSNPFKPVVCQVCHYTPALDLAQVGPKGPENDPANANGRNQLKQKSMSNVMHSHHAAVTDASGKKLFPDMPAPTADSLTTGGLPGNQASRLTVLDQTCYQCHPGKNTKCMRGAMADGGMVCQDCHGQMAQVGKDFSKDVSPTSVGNFHLAKDFYTNPATLRVPWANEPGCGSCHTGTATDNLASSTGVVRNGYDTNGIKDGIRLIRAYRSTDANAKPIVPTNKRFAENTVPVSFNGFANPGAGNPKLYRVSTGHGGVMCEGCHGATHAEWDTDGSPLKNDNVTAMQLQGHAGTVSECSTCHVTTSMSATTLDGPHGMHLVNDSRFYREGHESLAKTENGKPNRGACGACHGADHNGTVLSRAPVDRTFTVEGGTRTVRAGEPVGCGLCHSLSDSFSTGG